MHFLSLLCLACLLFIQNSFAGKNENPPLLPPPIVISGEDPFIQKEWYLQSMGVLQVWQKFSQGSPATIVAIIDSGVDYNDPDLAANIYRNPKEIPNNGIDDDNNGFVDDYIGWDFVLNQPLPFDRSGHGTFMAGIIAAVEGNGIGGAGICPKCSILPVRFLNWEGLGDDEDAIKAIYYAAKAGAPVINLSFAGEGKDIDLFHALEFANKKDALVVVAAGNDSENLDHTGVYPAKYDLPNLITVAAVDEADALSKRSNWSKNFVHIAAPGDNIWGPWLGKWDNGEGTSDAAAIVSGAAGLLRSIAPELQAAQIKKILMNTVRKVPTLKNKTITEGVIDVKAAVQCAVNPKLPCL